MTKPLGIVGGTYPLPTAGRASEKQYMRVNTCVLKPRHNCDDSNLLNSNVRSLAPAAMYHWYSNNICTLHCTVRWSCHTFPRHCAAGAVLLLSGRGNHTRSHSAWGNYHVYYRRMVRRQKRTGRGFLNMIWPCGMFFFWFPS